jgi:zinc-ribbon domain
MNRFDGRSAVEEYVSSHPLSYSTPDLILKEFVVWLCEEIDDPRVEGREKIPRIMLYTKSEERVHRSPDREKDSFQNPSFKSDSSTKETPTNMQEERFCTECGLKLNLNTKFCTRCGTKQGDV